MGRSLTLIFWWQDMENLKKRGFHSVSAGQYGKLSSFMLSWIQGLNVKKTYTYMGELVSKLLSCWDKFVFDLGGGRMPFNSPWSLSSTKEQLSASLLKRMLLQLRSVF